MSNPPVWKDLLLAKPFDPDKHDCSNWIASEKLDGVRAYWDGVRNLWSRQKKIINAPTWFTGALPSDIPLDGELFAGRGNFQFLVGAVRKNIENIVDDEWRQVHYDVFDIPLSKKPYIERIQQLRELENDILKPCKTWVINSNEELLKQLDEISKEGAEGIMVREPFSKYEWKRSSTLLKLKVRYDSEGIVIGHQEGTGKYTGMLGALIVETVGDDNLGIPKGKKFKIGTGFTDVQRNQELYPLGTVVTFLFTELTKSKIPRFPVFDRIRIDEDL